MTDVALVDTNLLALLAVGSASRSYIRAHKRINADFAIEHFELLVEFLGEFGEIILLPQVVAETSNLIRQIQHPARNHIQIILKDIIKNNYEFHATSRHAVERQEYFDLGITDSVILHLCGLQLQGLSPTLLTIDVNLVNRANALGYSAINFREFMV